MKIAACALLVVLAALGGFLAPRTLHPRPDAEPGRASAVLEGFSPEAFIKQCFPKATVQKMLPGGGLHTAAAWWDLDAQVTANGPGLEDANAVRGTVHERLKAHVDTAVGPTKMAGGINSFTGVAPHLE